MSFEDQRKSSRFRGQWFAKGSSKNLRIDFITLFPRHTDNSSTVSKLLLNDRRNNIPSSSERKSTRGRAHLVKDETAFLNDRLKERSTRNFRKRKRDAKIHGISLKSD